MGAAAPLIGAAVGGALGMSGAVTEDGRRLNPVQVLSEASLDLLTLLVLIEVHVECAQLGQERIIALDDVFQSVDSVHRVRTLEYMAGRLRGWQVIWL